MVKSFTDKPGLGDLMKKAQEMQKKMQDIQKQVTEMKVTGQAGGDLVKVLMNGQHKAEKTTLNPTILEEEISIIEDLITAAINDASTKVEKGTREKMSSLTGIKLPDGFNLPEDNG
ncbi:MAG: ybaB [Gammaproteobacteria bacterium]|jgi:DNA-binding YbaB/EbfC family protein|nr:ybaB [Gammaproteobacteria bacterium]